MIESRYYQDAADAALWDYFRNKPALVEGRIVPRNPLVAMPTGTGKSLSIGRFIAGAVKAYPQTRVLMMTHVKELIEQNANKLLEIWPEAPLGIYSAGLGKKQLAPIVYAGVQTIKNNIDKLGRIDFAIIDEAHLLSPKDDGTYKDIITRLQAVNPYMPVIGFTATPYRLGIGSLTNNGIFTDTAIDLTTLEAFNRLVNEGYLAPLVTKRRGNIVVDTSNVGLSNGEYKQAELQRAADDTQLTNAIVYDILINAYSAGRSSAIIFASGIEHAQHISDCFAHYGVEVPAVHSKMESGQRDRILQDFKAGRYWGMVGNNIFTTGFDHPPIDFIACVRPTTSTGLWVQMLGRGTRPSFGKHNCIAAGSLVLTNNGLIPIEHVSTGDKVWDGVSFVTHDGVICKGFQNVIRYAGLDATHDHEVYTPEGWRTFGRCAVENLTICVTGNGRQAIRLARGIVRRDCQRSQRRTKLTRTLHWMRQRGASLLQPYSSQLEWLSSLHCFDKGNLHNSTEMGGDTVLCCAEPLYESKEPAIYRLWYAGYTFQLSICRGYGRVRAYLTKLRQTVANRSKRQQRKLRTGEPCLVNCVAERNEQAQSYKRVYDIANCGPRNRFTVNGLLVHNCLVHDYSGNCERLGPINDPVIPKLRGSGGGGDAPVWCCPACSTYNHARAPFCEACGNKHDMTAGYTRNASNLEVMVSETPIVEMFEVNHVYYYRHVKRADPFAPPLLRVRYACGVQSFDEYIALEATGPRRSIARNWWKQRFNDVVPDTVDQALVMVNQLKTPRRINVHINKKYPEIVGVEF